MESLKLFPYCRSAPIARATAKRLLKQTTLSVRLWLALATAKCCLSCGDQPSASTEPRMAAHVRNC